MINTTRQIKIFLSSTFNDMHAERDLIMHKVYPAVSQELAAKNIKVQFVDLRWGVNTQDVEENERENVVLRECISEIRTSRPFFIGLLGDRYGWTPPKESWENVLQGMTAEEKEFILGESDDQKSVTELEILFGALLHNNFLRRSLFCFRTDDVYAAMDDRAKRVYCDSDELNRMRLSSLKQKITDRFQHTGHETNLHTYSCHWDGTRLTGMDDLAAFLTDAIVKEVVLYECSDQTVSPSTEFEQLAAADETKGAGALSRFVGREKVLDQLTGYCVQPGKPLLLLSHGGFGKTSLLCKFRDELMQSDEFLPLVHFTDKKAINRQPATILKKCLADKRLAYDQYYSLDQDVDFGELAFHFRRAIEALGDSKKVVLLIDDVHLLDTAGQFMLFSWLPDKVQLIMTADQSWPLLSFADIKAERLKLPALSANEARTMIESLLKETGKSLPATVMNAMLEFSYEGFTSSSCPLWNILMVRKLTRLSSADFQQIKARPETDEALKIQNYLLELVQTTHPHPEPLFLSIIQDSGSFIDGDFTWPVLKFIAASSDGLRESDLQLLIADKWDALSFAAMKRWMGDLLTIDAESGRIDYAYEGYRLMMSLPEESMVSYYMRLLDHLGSTRDKQPDDAVANYELPGLAFKLREGMLVKFLLADQRSELWAQTRAALAFYLLKEQEITANWCKTGFKEAPLEMLRLMIEVIRYFISIQLKKLALDLLKFSFGEVIDKLEDERFTYDLDQLRLMMAELTLEEGDLESSQKLTNYLLNTGMERVKTNPLYRPLMSQVAALQASFAVRQQQWEDAHALANYAVSGLEEQLLEGSNPEALDSLTAAMRVLLSIYKQTDQESYPSVKKYFSLRYTGEDWMFERYRRIAVLIRQGGFMVHAGNGFCGKLLLDEAVGIAAALHTYVPGNRLFYQALVQATLSHYALTGEGDPSAIASYYDQLNVVGSEETDELCVQCLLVLYRHEGIDHPTLVQAVNDSFDLSRLASSLNLSTQASVYQLNRLLGTDLAGYNNEITADDALALAGELLLYRNDPEGAIFFIGLYDQLKPELHPSEAAEIERNVVECLVAASQQDTAKVVAYFEVLKDFLRSIPSVESFIAVNDYLRLRNQVRFNMNESGPGESLQIFTDMLHLLKNNTDANYAYTLQLQVAFYMVCSQAEFFMLPMLRHGMLTEAKKLLNDLQHAVAEMKGLHYTDRLVLTAYSLVYGTYSPFFEETGMLQEALYYAKQHEYTVYENYRNNPGDRELKRRYAGALDNTGRLWLTYFQSPDEAEQSFVNAFHLFNELYQDDDTGGLLNDMLINAHNLMQAMHRNKEYRRAIDFAVELLGAVDMDEPTLDQRTVASLYDDLSDHYDAIGEMDQEYEALLKAREIFGDILKSSPANELFLRDYVQNGIRMVLFLSEKKQDLELALNMMTEVKLSLDQATRLLEASVKLNYLSIHYHFLNAKLLIYAGKLKKAAEELEVFVTLSAVAIRDKKNKSVIPLLWYGLSENFTAAAQIGWMEGARQLAAMEFRLKKEFIQEKIIREEDAELDAVLKKVEILDQLDSPATT